MKVKDLLTCLIVFYVCCTSLVCMAELSEQDEKKVRLVYDNVFKVYEKIEQENARVVNVNGITMGYLDFGPKNGVPLLWAHGSHSTGYEVLNVKNGLIDAGYRVIAIDYRGHGKTQITDFNTSIYDVADDMAALMDHLFISKAVIGGWSKGGFIATAFYDSYPGRTLGLLLEDGGSWSHQKRKDEYPSTEDAIKSEQKFEDKLNQSNSYSSQFDMFREQVSPWVDALSVDMAVRLLSSQRVNSEGRWEYHISSQQLYGNYSENLLLKLPSRAPLMQWSQESLIPEVIFRNLDVPVHILDPVSEHDLHQVSHQNKALKSRHPYLIEHEIYEDTSHSVHFERPERFVESAKALLKRVKSRLEMP